MFADYSDNQSNLIRRLLASFRSRSLASGNMTFSRWAPYGFNCGILADAESTKALREHRPSVIKVDIPRVDPSRARMHLDAHAHSLISRWIRTKESISGIPTSMMDKQGGRKLLCLTTGR